MAGHVEVSPNAALWLSDDNDSDTTDQLASFTLVSPPTNAPSNAVNANTNTSTKAQKASKPAATKFTPKQKPLTYAERFALEAKIGNPTSEEKRAAAKPTVACDVTGEQTSPGPSHSHSCNESDGQRNENPNNADILIIDSAPNSPHYDLDNRHHPYQSNSGTASGNGWDGDYGDCDYEDTEIPMDDFYTLNTTHPQYHDTHAQPPPQSQLQSQSRSQYKPYTLKDYQHLPKAVSLGTLGSSVPPEQIEKARERQRLMKAKAEKIRLDNSKRSQIEERKGAAAGAITVTEPKPKSKREIAKEFAKNVPKPRTVTNTHANTSNASRRAPSQGLSVSKSADDDLVEVLLRQQEAERLRVQQIKDSLGLNQ